MTNDELATTIIASVGGCGNIEFVTHCATRLRFNLHDHSLIHSSEFEAMDEILSIVEGMGQYQLVIGANVNELFEIISDRLDQHASNEKPSPKKLHIKHLSAQLVELLAPLLPFLIAAGFLRFILVVMILYTPVQPQDGTYQILSAAANAPFYFLPLLIAFRTAKWLSASALIALVIAASLLHLDSNTRWPVDTLLRFGHVNIPYFHYGSAVIPIIVLTWGMARLQHYLDHHLSPVTRIVITPALCLLILVPLAFLVMGPLGYSLQNILAYHEHQLYFIQPMVAGFLLASLWPIIGLLGLQWGILILLIPHLEFSVLAPILACSALGQSGAAAAVWLKTRHQVDAYQSFFAALLSLLGISEPAIYGVTLRSNRSFMWGCLSAGCAGALIAGQTSYGYSMILPNLLTLLYTATISYAQTTAIIAAIMISFLGAFIGSYFTMKSPLSASQNEPIEPAPSVKQNLVARSQLLPSPLSGTIVTQEQINDMTFALQMLGKGLAIEPSDNIVTSPISGTVHQLFSGHNAISLQSEDGIEMLIHIGLHTAHFGHPYFTAFVQTGDKVAVGQPLIHFDRNALLQAGIDLTTPILITNAEQFQDVTHTQSSEIVNSQPLIVITNDLLDSQWPASSSSG
ncbi:glucose PTS transporter subunit IIA [Celerinatantimonas yamalensis]|uniref:Glucose PTS transporter subunit IIA n=1 Tax=Celerinatantimonas yamalensis TaxID=559956 RepID=A0ABW9G7E4_9GAMM